MPVPSLNPGQTAILVVDMQEKLLPHIHEGQAVLAQACKLAQGARILGVPVVATEQYRKGLGTVPEMLKSLGPGAKIHEKLKFSALIDPVKRQLVESGARAVIVCGVETHVCVLQTCLELIENGFIPFIAADATGSRRIADRDPAMQRMIHAGVVPTTVESVLFELLGEASGERFKAILNLVK